MKTYFIFNYFTDGVRNKVSKQNEGGVMNASVLSRHYVTSLRTFSL